MALKGKKVYVPVCRLGIGTGKAAVIDRRSELEVHFRTRTVKLVGNVVCVEANSQGVEDGLHRVVLPGGFVAWVEVLEPSLGTAA